MGACSSKEQDDASVVVRKQQQQQPARQQHSVGGEVGGEAAAAAVGKKKKRRSPAPAAARPAPAAAREEADRAALFGDQEGGGGEAAEAEAGGRPRTDEKVVDSMLKKLTVETQEKTLGKLETTHRLLQQTVEVASTTEDVLDAQAEQLKTVSRDLVHVKDDVSRAGKQLDSLERWYICGGKTSRRGKEAEKKALQVDTSDTFGRREMERAGETYGVDVPQQRRRPRKGDVKAPRTVKAPRAGSKWELSRGPEGDDDSGDESLAEVRKNNDRIDDTMGHIEGLVDVLQLKAAGMNEETRQRNGMLNGMRTDLNAVNRGVANVNARAKANNR